MRTARSGFAVRLVAGAVLALAALGCPAQSLRDLLTQKGLPESGFTAMELEEVVYGIDLSDSRSIFVAYLKNRGQENGNAPRLVRMDRESGTLQRRTVKVEALEIAPAPGTEETNGNPPEKKKDACCTSLPGLRFLGENLVLTARYPSGTTAQVILSRGLKQLQTIYGQELFEIGAGEILSNREGSRLPAVHSERLDVNRPETGQVEQVYPLAGDRLRAAFVAQAERDLPPRANCGSADACDAEIFDETISFVGTNRLGGFAVVVNRLADHTVSGGVMSAQSVLYVFAPEGESWRYCQQEIEGSEADGLEAKTAREYKAIAGRCTGASQPVQAAVTKAQRGEGMASQSAI